MSLDADRLIDRRRLKRRLMFWRLAAVVATLALIAVAARPYFGEVAGEHVAKLTIDGIILDETRRLAALDAVAKDPAAKALIVAIDTPGGSVVGGESLFRGLRNVAAAKPVVAVMGDLATSAGYMAAIGADHIIAHPGSLTGSIGVLMQTADVTGLLDKLGIEPHVVKSAPLKAQPNPLEPFTPAAREATRAVVMDIYDLFVDMVADRRAMDRPRVLGLADGRVFTGRQAQAAGLVDALGGETEARQWLAAERGVAESLPLHVVEIREEKDWWLDFLGGALGKSVFSERLRLDGLISVWHPEGR